MSGNARDSDMPRLQMQKEQYVVGNEATPGEHFNGEEIYPCQNSHMRSNEVRPSRLLTTFGRRSDAEATQNVSHGLIRNPTAEILKCSRNSVVSPPRILACHTDDEFRDLSPDGRPSRIAAVFRAVELLSD